MRRALDLGADAAVKDDRQSNWRVTVGPICGDHLTLPGLRAGWYHSAMLSYENLWRYERLYERQRALECDRRRNGFTYSSHPQRTGVWKGVRSICLRVGRLMYIRRRRLQSAGNQKSPNTEHDGGRNRHS